MIMAGEPPAQPNSPPGPSREAELINIARQQAGGRSPPGAQSPVSADPDAETVKSPAISEVPVLPADFFPGYHVIKEFRHGGQGVVYQAIHKGMGRRVAIKVMRDAVFASSRERTRFQREIEILAQLRHPNIVAIHDSGVASGLPYFVMDYISGLALDEYIEQQRAKA